MRLVRSLAVGFGAGAAILLSATPALADEPGDQAPEAPVAVEAAPSTTPKPSPTSAPPSSSPPPAPTKAPGTPESYPAPGPQVDSTPKGGVQTGGGPVEDDSALLVGGGVAAAAVLGLGGMLVRRRAVGRAG